jgi:hypothetical protein
VLDSSDKVKLLDLLKGDMSLEEVGRHRGKNGSSTHSQVLSSAHPDRCGFSSVVVSWKPRVYCANLADGNLATLASRFQNFSILLHFIHR